MKNVFIAAVLCLLPALLMPPAAAAGPVFVSPKDLPQACVEDIHDETNYSRPVSVYAVRNLKQDRDDPYKITFQISDSTKIEFYNEFAHDYDDETLQQVDSYIKKKQGLYVAFTQPGTAIEASGNDAILDFFLIASIRMGNGNPPMCMFLTKASGLPQESYSHMPQRIQQLMNKVKDTMANDFANAFLKMSKGTDTATSTDTMPEVTIVK